MITLNGVGQALTMLSPERNVRLIRKNFHKRFRMARMVRDHRSLNRVAGRLLFDGDVIYYTPKDSAVGKSRRLEVSIDAGVKDDTVLPADVARELIERSRYHYVMDFCICRSSSGCEDFPTELGCIFLGRGTKNIRGNVGRMVTKEEALRHLELCREAGLVQLVGRNKIDSVWLDSGKKEDLLTICNCCPCCCLWKMLPDLPENISEKISRLPGVEVAVDPDRCIGCGLCGESCFVGALRISDGKCVIDDSACRGCGRCADACPHDAISVRTSEVSIEASVEEMCGLVDIESER